MPPNEPVAPAPVAAPAVAASAVAPAAVAAAPVEPSASAPAAAAPVEAAAPSAAVLPDNKPEIAAEKPTLLETFDKDAAEKTAKDKVDAAAAAAGAKPDDKTAKSDAKAPDAAKPADAKADAKPADPVKAAAPEPLKYEELYKLPETVKIDDTGRTELHAALDAFRADPAKGTQGLVDLHVKRMTDYAQQVQQEQQRAFAETRSGWVTDVLAHPEIGGAGHQTAMKAIARARDLLVSSHKIGTQAYNADLASFESFLRVTGAGDHPAFLTLLHNAAPYIDEPAAPPPNAKPTGNNGRDPGERRSKILYDNPRSNSNRTS